MTTDRTAAPPRSSALNVRASAAPAAGRPQPAAPTDAFSALLGAAAPRTDNAPRPESPRGRRDDGPRHEHQRPNRDAKPARADEPKAPEAPQAPEATTPTEEPTETDAPTRVVTSDIFALQLAGPLPTAPQATPVTGTAAPAEAQVPTPALPAFAPTNLSLAAGVPQATVPAAAEVTGEPVTGEPTPATPATGGGIPLPLLAGLTPASAADLEGIELPATPPQAVPTETVAAPQPDGATALPGANAEQTPSDSQSQPQQPQPNTAPAATQQAKPADAPAPVTTQPVVQAAPAAPALPTQPASALERAVPLYRAPETAATMIQIAAERGVTHARLHLKPVELGGIEVRLQTTPQGITAQLVADSAEAAKLLTQAADDLRRDLDERGVNLLSLDVSTQHERHQQEQAGGFQADIFGDDYRPGQNRAIRVGSNGDVGLADGAAAAETTLVLPNGVLVDVLA